MATCRRTTRELTFAYLRDLVVDIRCARRDDMPDYAAKVAGEFRRLWANRHGARIARYGVPEPCPRAAIAKATGQAS